MAASDSRSSSPRFSICIPNFNYGRYLGETITGVLNQEFDNIEIRVADNDSTDDSVEVVQAFGDQRIHLKINETNVGFGPNLDRAAHDAQGEIMILLSSDDLMRNGALAAYDKLFAADPGATMLVGSTVERIDSKGNTIGLDPIDEAVWTGAKEETELSRSIGHRVISLPPHKLLRQSLSVMRTPFVFATTAYSRELYTKVGGYRGNRSYGPDKWFNWLTLAHADKVYLVDSPLFAYRWHDDNQAAIESSRGSLRFLIDEYLNTMELPAEVLDVVGLTRDDVIDAFVEYDIARHGLASLARGNHVRARRVSTFGDSAYRSHVNRNPKARLLRVLSRTGPVGVHLARLAKNRVQLDGPKPRD